MAEWRDANDRVRELESSEADVAAPTAVEDLPAAVRDLEMQVRRDPMFARSFSYVPSEIKMVELDTLVVFQKVIDLAFVRTIQEALGKAPTTQEIFKLCFPIERALPLFRVQRVAQNVHVFVSPSNDLRFLEPILLDPSQLEGYVAPAPVIGIVGLVVGFSANYMQAVEAENRLVLHNGSNRAYALRELGIKKVPCIVQRVTRREELELVGSAELVKDPDRYLKAARPPLLKDYFDPALRKIVRVPRTARLVKLTFGVEPMDTPAA